MGSYSVGKQRICGRAFNVFSDSHLATSVCSELSNFNHGICLRIYLIPARTVPFRVTFKTDSNEETSGEEADTNEQDFYPGGIIGFSLDWAQVEC